MSGPKHRPPPHLGDPPALPLPDPHQNGKGWNRRPTLVAAPAADRAWRRMQVKCPGCGWLGLRGSTKCCKCGCRLPIRQAHGPERSRRAAGKKEK